MAQLNTQILLRNDSTENWNINKEKVLGKGEMGIEFCVGGTKKMKSGDGVNRYNNLPWISALAADVYDWAKSATKPVYTAAEVGALPSSTLIPSKTSQLTNDSNFIKSTDTINCGTW